MSMSQRYCAHCGAPIEEWIHELILLCAACLEVVDRPMARELAASGLDADEIGEAMGLKAETVAKLLEIEAPRVFPCVLLHEYKTAAEYLKMRAAAVDQNMLPSTFEEFERRSAVAFDSLVAKDQLVEKVLLDVDVLIRWCAAQGRPLDQSARYTFIRLTVAERNSRAGHA